jgi:hypothetical protein
MMKIAPIRACVVVALLAWGVAVQAQQAFSFVALGDLQYGSPEKAYGPYRALIARINQVEPAFSIHLGDIKSGSTPCSDEEYANQRDHFQRFKGAVVYTPGDNEWTDCHRASNGAYDPLERLAAVRKVFFNPGQSLGSQPMRVESQAQRTPAFGSYLENLRWQHQGVQFNTVHIVGSNNNLEARDAAASREFHERDAANVAWIQSAFAQAAEQQPSLIVFAFQADVFASKSMFEDFPGWSGFRKSIGETLLPLAQRWGKPVLVIHGDSHQFKLDQPFSLSRQPLPHVTRLMVPGASDVRAVKVTVQPGAALTFELISPAP